MMARCAPTGGIFTTMMMTIEYFFVQRDSSMFSFSDGFSSLMVTACCLAMGTPVGEQGALGVAAGG